MAYNSKEFLEWADAASPDEVADEFFRYVEIRVVPEDRHLMYQNLMRITIRKMCGVPKDKMHLGLHDVRTIPLAGEGDEDA